MSVGKEQMYEKNLDYRGVGACGLGAAGTIEEDGV
jgi:hypothetical protein